MGGGGGIKSMLIFKIGPKRMNNLHKSGLNFFNDSLRIRKQKKIINDMGEVYMAF